MNCHPSERHIRLALSSPMLHEPLSLGGEARDDLEQFGRRPAVTGESCGRRLSCKSLAEAPAATSTAAATATRKSGNRRKQRQRHKLANAQETRSGRRTRSRPIVCDTDSDTCEPGAELRQAARDAAKAQHHARSAASLALMLHNCETIDAGQRSPATPAEAGRPADCEAAPAADSGVYGAQRRPSAIAAPELASERQFCAAELPPVRQTNAQPGQRRGRPTSSAAENNAERRQESVSDSAGPADKVDGAAAFAAAGELANGSGRHSGRHEHSAASSPASEQGRELEPERDRPSSWQDQDQSCASERDAVEAKFKLTAAAASSISERDPKPERHLEGGPLNAMGVDVNNVVSRLVDTCAQSWRRSQSSLLASNSRCYKVAQLNANLLHESQAAPSSRLCEQQQQQRLQQQREREQEVARNDCDSSKQVVATSRLTRPGRSPVSLQRQTNARLARHRLQIQQQRQEQLAKLARGEREQFHYRALSSRRHHHNAPGLICSSTSTSFQSSSQHPDHTEIEILASEPADGQARRSSLEHSLDYFRNLIGRLPASLNPSRRQSRELTLATRDPEDSPEATRLPLPHLNGQLPARGRGRSFRAVQRPPVASSSDSTASSQCALTIEPSHLQRAINANISSAASSRTRRPRDLVQVLAQANVIVHRSPNDLLRDGRAGVGGANTRHPRQQQQQQHQEANRSDAQNQASRGQQQPQAQQHQFRFQYHHHMAAELQKGKSAAGRGQKAPGEDSRSNSGDSSASSTLSLNKPFCKICHLSSSRHGDKLISPCKCSGTMQYVHCGCLLKWLEISNRANEKQPMSCELCAHEYTWHKRFNLKQMKLPKCSLKDIFLHSIFVLALGVMMFCALAPMFNTTRAASGGQPLMTARNNNNNNKMQLSTQSFAQNPGDEVAKMSSRGSVIFGDDALGSLMSNPARRSAFKSSSSSSAAGSRLANDEKFILFCAAAFFVSFFVAIYAQTKARDTLYGLIVKFANMNLTYYITEYDHGQQQQQQQSTSNKSAADYCNSLCGNPTDSNHGDLNHCQPPAPAGTHPQAPLTAGQTHGRQRAADYCESPSSGRHFKRT